MVSRKYLPRSLVQYKSTDGRIIRGYVMPYDVAEVQDSRNSGPKDELRVWAYWDDEGRAGWLPERSILANKMRRNLPEWW